MVVLVDNKVSRAGWGVVLCGLLLSLSAFPGLRVGAGGLQVHPINFAVLVLLVGSLPRLRVIPPHILLALLFLVGIFALVTLTQGSGLSLVLKVASSAATVLCVAAGTRTRGDFRAATIAILLSAVIISCRGLLFGDLESVAGINPMDG